MPKPDAVNLELVIEENNKPLVVGDGMQMLIDTLTPLTPNIGAHMVTVQNMVVDSQESAEAMVKVTGRITADIKEVQFAIKEYKQAAKHRHALWCDLEGLFVEAFERAYSAGKTKLIAWDQAQRQRAEEERKRQQAIVDERARKEKAAAEAAAKKQRDAEEAARREAEEKQRLADEATNKQKKARLEAEAAEAKKKAAAAAAKAEKADERVANVAPAPVITVTAERAKGSRIQYRWKVSKYDMDEMGIPKDTQGFVTIELGRLERVKIANTMFALKGVTFEKVPV